MKGIRGTYLALVASLAALLSPMIANADPITYDFTVTATNGPLVGTVSSGYFTFDDAIIPTGEGTVNAIGLLDTLNFSWNSIDYDSFSANTGALSFAADRSLARAFFGSSCGIGTCGLTGNQNDIFVDGVFFNYTVPDQTAFYLGRVAYSRRTTPTTSVPEPPTLALLGIGLVGVAVQRRKLT